MPKYSLAAVVLCLYVVGAVWVVRGEGEAYRQALRARTRATSQPVVAAPTSSAPSPVVAVPTPTPDVSEPRPILPAVSSASALPEEPAGPVAMVKEGPTPAAVVPKPIELPPEPWGKVSAEMKPEDEVLLGRELHSMVLALNVELNDGPWQQRIEEAAAPFLKARDRKEFDYTFTVLDSDAVNAFSHPGGYIYVCRGLFDMIGEDEDVAPCALEFVLAHEVAHVDRRHALKCLETGNEAGKKHGLTTADQCYLGIAIGFPDDMEYEADAWAYQQMTKLDRTRRERLAFLRKFVDYATREKFPNGRIRPPLPKGDAPGPGKVAVPPRPIVENHFRAHPAAWKRLAKLAEGAGAVPRSAANSPPGTRPNPPDPAASPRGPAHRH